MPKCAENKGLELFELSLFGSGNSCNKSKYCRKRVTNVEERLGPRFFTPTPDGIKQVIPACISISAISEGKGLNATYRYDARKASQNGFWVEEFSKQNFISDIHDINVSAPERSGKPLSESYKKTVEEMGGNPSNFLKLGEVVCPRHWDAWFGVFVEADKRIFDTGLELTKRLVAYSNVRRNGDLIQLNLIMGHADFLKQNVMKLLISQIFTQFATDAEPRFSDALAIFYAGYYQGGAGLQKFKRYCGFAPASLKMRAED